MVEVKTEGTRERTVKVRAEHPFAARDHLTPAALTFVHDQLRIHASNMRGIDGPLRATVVTAYTRHTLVERDGRYRLTLDTGLTFRDQTRTLTGPQDLVLVETKSTSRPTPVNRWLWQHRVRPVSLSKYCIGAAALNPSLPASRWARVLRRHYAWEPTRLH